MLGLIILLSSKSEDVGKNLLELSKAKTNGFSTRPVLTLPKIMSSRKITGNPPPANGGTPPGVPPPNANLAETTGSLSDSKMPAEDETSVATD